MRRSRCGLGHCGTYELFLAGEAAPICIRYTVQAELAHVLKDYVGRESPLYHAERLSEHYRK